MFVFHRLVFIPVLSNGERIIQFNHPVAHVILVASEVRTSVEALPGVIADQAKKCPVKAIGPKVRFLFSLSGFVAF
jgi:hypothetical protein